MSLHLSHGNISLWPLNNKELLSDLTFQTKEPYSQSYTKSNELVQKKLVGFGATISISDLSEKSIFSQYPSKIE